MDKSVVAQAKALMEGEKDVIAILSNLSALLNVSMETINWVGFYLFKEDHLILGPFQGKPACIHLYPGKGVCSHALETKEIVVVDDVHEFPGHIACDAASQSEVVFPIYINDKPFGVLDIDAPVLARFKREDVNVLKEIVDDLQSYLEETLAKN